MCVLGLDNAGKTTILRSLAHEEINTVQPTQGFNVKTLQVSNFRFNVWDLGGQSAIREHWPNYYDNLDCIIYVVDSSDNRRMEDECGGELQKLLVDDKLAGVPILVFANKQDLELAMPADEIEETLHLSEINDRPWNIQACSAQNGEGKLQISKNLNDLYLSQVCRKAQNGSQTF